MRALGHWTAPTAHHMHAGNFCPDLIAITKTFLHHYAPCRPSKFDRSTQERPFQHVFASRRRKLSPRTCPTELYSTGTRTARSLVLRPEADRLGRSRASCLTTSHSDAVFGLTPSIVPVALPPPSSYPLSFLKQFLLWQLSPLPGFLARSDLSLRPILRGTEGIAPSQTLSTPQDA